MRIDIPEDLTSRLEHFAKGTGQDIQALVREAIETRLDIEEHLARNLEGWTDDALRVAIQEGLASGAPTPLDMDAIKREARQQRGPSV
jgi:predicted transcriptional regulator